MPEDTRVGILIHEGHETAVRFHALVVQVKGVRSPRNGFFVQALGAGDLCPGEAGVLLFYEVTFLCGRILDIEFQKQPVVLSDQL